MPYAVNKVSGLSSTLQSVAKACTYVEKYADDIRPFVPAPNLEAYDAGIAAIIAVCNILKIVARLQIVGAGE